jgi:hypothetical protein
MQHQLITLPEETGNEAHKPVASLSFRPFLDYVRQRLQDQDSIKKDIYELILEKFAAYPELEDSIPVEATGKYKSLLDLLYIVLSTVIEDDKKVYWGLAVPVTPIIFYGSNPLYDLLLQAGTQNLNKEMLGDKDRLVREKKEMLYSFVLERLYGFSFNKKQMIRTTYDAETRLHRHYQINIDTRFVEISHTKTLPDLNLETLEIHLHEEAGLNVLERVLPMQHFHFTGFSILTITEVTGDYAYEKIKEVLVNGHGNDGEETFETVIESLKAISGTSELEFSLLPLFRVNDRMVQDIDAYCHSVIFTAGESKGLRRDFFLPMIEKFIAAPRRIYFRDLEAAGPSHQETGKLLRAAGIKSYTLMPVYYTNKLVGAFEIYSRKKGILNELVFSRLETVMPLVAQLMQNSIDAFNTRINDTIRNKFTSLQPAVQWKFVEAAWNYLYQSRVEGKPPPLQKIEFKDVYPLYGAIDMRNSTTERNKAVLNDLSYQLTLLQKVFTALKEKSGFGLADELVFKCGKWQHYLQEMVTTNDEIRINQFLADEAHPFLQHFRHSNRALETVINDYFHAIEPATGDAWRHRRALEESMQTINQAVNNYLDLMNTEIQQAYPCYFERFRTDGVEYDVYIGQSIAPDRAFHPVYLKNLRLWQIGSMAAIAKLSHLLLPTMKVPLQTTQLIFIYSNTIDISFRNDERRFDVEGGYNIRYHIIKKRIDKVHIKDTGERLTQPGKIALIYFDQKDADEYIDYIQHLQDKKLLTNDLEYLELEELQGVVGLKAIRVGVSLDGEGDFGV